MNVLITDRLRVIILSSDRYVVRFAIYVAFPLSVSNALKLRVNGAFYMIYLHFICPYLHLYPYHLQLMGDHLCK